MRPCHVVGQPQHPQARQACSQVGIAVIHRTHIAPLGLHLFVAFVDTVRAGTAFIRRELPVGRWGKGVCGVIKAPRQFNFIAAKVQRGTATGSGIILSLATIFPDAGIEISQATGQRNMPGPLDEKKDKKQEFTPVPPGW